MGNAHARRKRRRSRHGHRRPQDRKTYHAGRPCRAVLKIDLNTKEIISEYSSISEATRENNMKTSSNIRAVCKGLRNHAGGYGWRYREEVMKCSR